MTRQVGFNKKSTPETSKSNSQAWDDILDPGERIIWQDRPDGTVALTGKNISFAMFGCAFAGFALFWMVAASGAGGNFWMFGLLHFSVGAGIILAALFGGAFVRRHTWYTLTDKRAIIATDLPIKGKSFKSYPITETTRLDFRDDTPASIYFAQETKRGKNGTYTVDVGFERIPDGRDIYNKLRKVQGARV